MSNIFPINGVPGFIPFIGNDRTNKNAFGAGYTPPSGTPVSSNGTYNISPSAGTVLGADNTNLGDGGTSYSGGYGGGGGGTSTASSGPTAQDVADALAVFGHTYETQNQDLNNQFTAAQTQHDTQANTLNSYYGQQQQALDTGKTNQDQQLLNTMASHGVAPGDSAYDFYNNQNNTSYQQQVTNLHQEQLGKLQQIDGALQDAKNQLNTYRQNLDITQFQTLGQYQDALNAIGQSSAQLNQQHDAIKNAILGSKAAIQGVTTSGAYDSANATQGMLDQINKLIAAGTSKQQVQGFIRQGANKNELQSLLDYYQKATTNGVQPAPGLPAA